MIVVIAMQRARDVLFVLPLDPKIAKTARRDTLAMVAARGGDTAIGQVARAIVEAEPDDRVVALEDARDRIRERVAGRLLWLRVLAPAATALGLAGTAVQASWAQHPPGLYALDPSGAMGMAASDGAMCLALGFAGSTTALGALFFLRRRALAILAGVDRLADAAREAWTSP